MNELLKKDKSITTGRSGVLQPSQKASGDKTTPLASLGVSGGGSGAMMNPFAIADPFGMSTPGQRTGKPTPTEPFFAFGALPTTRPDAVPTDCPAAIVQGRIQIETLGNIAIRIGKTATVSSICKCLRIGEVVDELDIVRSFWYCRMLMACWFSLRSQTWNCLRFLHKMATE